VVQDGVTDEDEDETGRADTGQISGQIVGALDGASPVPPSPSWPPSPSRGDATFDGGGAPPAPPSPPEDLTIKFDQPYSLDTAQRAVQADHAPQDNAPHADHADTGQISGQIAAHPQLAEQHAEAGVPRYPTP